MTIVVRILTSPLVYKSYVSSAKMKVIRPELNELNKKYPGKENAMKRQQETMAVQRKVRCKYDVWMYSCPVTDANFLRLI